MHLAPPVLLLLASYSAFIIGSIILAYSQYHPVASFNWHNHTPPRNTRATTGPALSMSRALDVEMSSIDDVRSTTTTTTIYRYDSPFLASSIADDGRRSSSALVVLNTPIVQQPRGGGDGCGGGGGGAPPLSGTVLGALWEASAYRVCADGGANRLHDATVVVATVRGGVCEGEDGEEEESVEEEDASSSHGCDYLPDLITGDLDSLRPDVRRYYESRGVPILRVEDQDYHDLDVRIDVSSDLGVSFFCAVSTRKVFHLHTPTPYCSSRPPPTEVVDGSGKVVRGSIFGGGIIRERRHNVARWSSGQIDDVHIRRIRRQIRSRNGRRERVIRVGEEGGIPTNDPGRVRRADVRLRATGIADEERNTNYVSGWGFTVVVGGGGGEPPTNDLPRGRGPNVRSHPHRGSMREGGDDRPSMESGRKRTPGVRRTRELLESCGR